MNNKWLKLLVVVMGLAAAPLSHAAMDWNAQDYDLYAGDFDGDGKTDILYVAKDPSKLSGIATADSYGVPNIVWQIWNSSFLNINWSGNQYNIVVADFNGDGKTDIFLQSSTPGDSYLLLTDSHGKISAIGQTVSNSAFGLTWSADQHKIISGDFNGDGKSDLFLQATSTTGTSAVIYADANGQFTAGPTQTPWADGYLGLNWSTQTAIVYAADFNSDHKADLLVQAKPKFVMIDYDVTFPVPTYPPAMNGLAISQGGTTPFPSTPLPQLWNRLDKGVDWSPLSNTLIVGDFNGDGVIDLLFQAKYSSQTSYLLAGNASGTAFSTAPLAISSNVALSSDSSRLIAGKFSGSAATGLYVQGLSTGSSNYIANSVGATVTASPIATVTLSSLPITAGKTPTTFSVGDSGAFEYSIPLQLPPLLGALKFNLTLSYNSRGPNSLLGVGWAVSGLSSISRCAKTWEQDGAPAAVNLTTSDRFCLDGKQLKLTNGTYGVSGSSYATEIETFSRIQASGAAGNGPTTFTLTTKNGLIYTYGGTSDSEIFAGTSGTVRTWGLSKITDRDGNAISLAYQNDGVGGSYRIDHITFPTTTTGVGPFYTIQFNYGARPSTDILSFSVAGYPAQETHQLNNITIKEFSSGATIRQYNLAYAQNTTTTNRITLTAVQECSVSSCLPTTTINYQSGTAGWPTAQTGSHVGYSYGWSTFVDLNGDGRTDVLTVDSNEHLVVQWGTANGFSSAVDTGQVNYGVYQAPYALVGSFLGNGQQQVLVSIDGSQHYALLSYNTSNGTFVTQPTSLVASVVLATVGDLDGDGLDDVIEVTNPYSSNSAVVAFRNITTTSTGAIQFASPVTMYVPPSGQNVATGGMRQGISVADFNGDGRADLLLMTIDSSYNIYNRPMLSNGFASAPTPAAVFTSHGPSNGSVYFGQLSPSIPIDWNGDGCTDIAVADITNPVTVLLSDCAGGFSPIATTITPSNAATPIVMTAVDWDGDGRQDLAYVAGDRSTMHVLKSTGIGVGTDYATGISWQSLGGLQFATSLQTADIDGDGLADLIFTGPCGYDCWHYHLHQGSATPPDLAVTFTDGFVMQQAPVYFPLTSGTYYQKYSTASFPEKDWQMPIYVVGQLNASDGTGSIYHNDFVYYGARIHAQGRGFEGMAARRQYDSRNGAYSYDYFAQTFPYTRMHVGNSYSPLNYLLWKASQWSATTDNLMLQGGAYQTRWFPFLKQETTAQWEVSGPKNGQQISQTIKQNSYDNYGNLTQAVVTTTDTDSAAPASPFNGQSWTTTVAATYDNDANNWCYGLPLTKSITNSAPGQATATRTWGYSVDGPHCRITEKVEEPGASGQTVTTDYSYGTAGTGCPGDLSAVSVTGQNPNGTAMVPRTTSYNYANSTTRCQLPEKITDSLGNSTTLTYNYNFGSTLSSNDPNGLTTSWLLDDFGRWNKETRPDSTYTTITRQYCVSTPCWGTGDLRYFETAYEFGADGVQYTSAQHYFDGFMRKRYEKSYRVLGVLTTKASYYDSLGRLYREDRPYSNSTNGYAQTTFDVLNRPTSISLYRDNAGTIDRTTSYSYLGRTVGITDPLGNVTTQVTDVKGLLRRVIDPSPGGTTQYSYDTFGNLNQTTDAIGKTSSATYNLRGFRTQMIDADAGMWNFQGDSLNEVVAWTDAKNQSFNQTFDPLGRMTSRTEPEGTSTWTWGTSAAAHNIGSLAGLSGYGYQETLGYDSMGRMSTRSITSDQAYQFAYTYNSFGKMGTVTYPTSPIPGGTQGSAYTIQYCYSYGIEFAIRDLTATGQVPCSTSGPPTIYSLGSANDYSSPLSEALGVGAGTTTVSSTYQPWTNHLLTVQSGTGASTTNIQNLAYQWDVDDNLMQRQDANQGLTERFTMDSLNRLTSSTLNGQPNLSVGYDAAGDITSRSDVGTYAYSTAHPHGVLSAGSNTFTYDANGNVASRNGLSFTWASYNLPTLLSGTVSGTTLTSQLWNGPEHQRYKQVATELNGTETTFYVGGLLEKMTASTTGVTYWRHYVNTPTGKVIVVSRNSDGSTSTNIILSDNLGSADAVVNGLTGAVNVQESFSPFGLRRQSNWQAGAPSYWDQVAVTQATRHGFTFQEHLDNVNLIHMNGRVYDPVVGRFLSVDPEQGDLTNSQRLNAYSYVNNRPLVATDPTGFSDVFGGEDSDDWPAPPSSATCGGPCSLYQITGSGTGGVPHFPWNSSERFGSVSVDSIDDNQGEHATSAQVVSGEATSVNDRSAGSSASQSSSKSSSGLTEIVVTGTRKAAQWVKDSANATWENMKWEWHHPLEDLMQVGQGFARSMDESPGAAVMPIGGLFEIGVVGEIDASAAAIAAEDVIRLHHAWPKYLGGAAKQDLVQLSKSQHDAFHSGLDKILPRQWGSAYYERLSPTAKQQVLQDLKGYTKAFDAKYGTKLYDALLRNGFPGP